MEKKKPSKQALAASKDDGWGSISSKSLDEFFNWLEAANEDACPSIR